MAKICRKVVKANSARQQGKIKHIVVDSANLEIYSGVRKFNYGRAEEESKVGQVTGLAWTQVGGELLVTIEVGCGERARALL
ncbi:MAG: S16 family serine protease [Pseudomonadales bacterium]